MRHLAFLFAFVFSVNASATFPFSFWKAGAGSNYFGDCSDGNVTISSNTNLTVPNKSGSYNGDAVVKNYNNLTINSGQTLTTDQPGRGMILYVCGNLVVNGTITMTARGAYVDPTSVSVGSGGLIFRRFKSGGSGSDSTSNQVTGMGSVAVSAENNQAAVVNGVVVAIPKVGGAGATVGGGSCAGSNGFSITNGTGGGGKGAEYGTASGSGAAGTCFSGGSGGNGAHQANPYAGNGIAYGGPGGDAVYGTASGGSGNPGGNLGNNGTGGLLVIIVKGTVTVGASGSITANGVGSPVNSESPGGASGGGVVVIFHGGSYSNSGTVSANGGVGATASGSGCKGGNGGNGSVIVQQVNP